MIGKIYISHQTQQGTNQFTSVPFHDASITWKQDEASTLEFKSPQLFHEGDRVRYQSDITNFGGQIYKITQKYGDDNTYSCISYQRLYHDKISLSCKNKTSSQIMKLALQKSKNNFRTSGIKNTSVVHSNLKWSNTSLWEIATQLCWLEHQGGYECECSIDSDGTLHFGYSPHQQKGYLFTEAIDYSEEHDSSDIITNYRVLYKGKTLASAEASKGLLAIWGYVGEEEDCTVTQTSSKSKTTTSTATGARDDAQIKKYNISKSVVNQALSIAKEGKSDYDNLKLLYNWCDKAISYKYYNNTKHGASGTLKHRSGNCCDNAHLLIAMARSVGIKARYCHAKQGDKGHVYGEYYVKNKWFVCDTGVTSTGRYWGSHCNYAGGTDVRYDKLPF